MNVGGKHLIIDIKNSDKIKELESFELLEPIMLEWMKEIKATVRSKHAEPFEFGGYSAVLVLAESHFSVHTFPEVGGISMDIYTCGGMNPFVLKDKILKFFGGDSEVVCLERSV